MKVVGLTGNIGTGKSAIMKVAATRGALTIDADKVVHSIQENNKEIQSKIGKAFGKEVLLPDGKINRPVLGPIVFSDPEKMAELESIIVPQVRIDIENMVNSATEPFVMIEAIKLLEGGLKDICDEIWVANCGKFLQLQRLIISRGMDEDEAFKRVMAQNPQEEKVAQATSVIDTTGTLAQTHTQVNDLLDELLAHLETDTVQDDVPQTSLLPDIESPDDAEVTEDVAAVEVDETPTVIDEVPMELPEITVRRARPSDIPSIMLLIHKATGGKIQPKRAEILQSLSDRGYLIGQTGSDITVIAGWYTDKGFAAIEQIFVYPTETASTTGMAVLNEIHKTANELMAEAIFSFMAPDTPDFVRQLLVDKGFGSDQVDNFPRVWREMLLDIQPIGTEALVYKLRDMRIN